MAVTSIPQPITGAGGGSGGTSQVDKATFSEGSSEFTPVGGVFNDTIGSPLTEDQGGVLRLTDLRAVHVNLRDTGGAERGILTSPLRVDPVGTTVQPISDGGGSLTVDAPAGTPVNVQVGDGTRTATVRDTGASDSLNVAIVDASGNQITSFGGGTEYTEDAASPADPVGATLNARRRDSLATETTTSGDWTTINCTGQGELYVKHVDSIPITAASLPLPTGAATEATLSTRLADTTFTGRINTQGQKTMAGSTPVVIASDQSAVPVSGTVTANAGSGTFNIQSNASVNLAQIAGTTILTGNGAAGAGAQRVTIASDNTAFGVNLAQYTPVTGRLPVDGSGVTQPVSGTVTANAGTGTFNIQSNASVNLAQIAGTTTSTGNGTAGAGVQRVTIASDNTAFTVNAAQSGTWTVQPGNTANTTPWLVSQRPATSGGLTTNRLLSAATTNATNVKASAGQVYGWVITNTNAAVRYVKFYNKASAPTVGTDTPVITLAIPGNSTGAGIVAAEFTSGIAFATGIGYATTTGAADSDTGAVAANEVIINLFYS